MPRSAPPLDLGRIQGVTLPFTERERLTRLYQNEAYVTRDAVSSLVTAV